MRFLHLKTFLHQSSNLAANNGHGFLRPLAQPSFVKFISTDEKKQLKKAQKQAKKDAARAAEPPIPEYFKARNGAWTILKLKYGEQLAAKPQQTIKISLPDGRDIDGTAWKTTPFEVAQGISSGLASDAIVAKANGQLWDLERPLESDCEIELLKFDDEQPAETTLWQSAACLLGEALERAYGVAAGGLLCGIGTSDKGFYADIHLKEGSVDLKVVQERYDKVMGQKTKFERIEATKEDALELFAYNEFQQRLVQSHPGDHIGIYRCGNAISLSSHPLLRHGKKIKVYKLLKHESAFWNDNKDAEPVQRVYGVAFMSDSQLAEFVRKQAA